MLAKGENTFTVVFLDGTEKKFKGTVLRQDGPAIQIYGTMEIVAIISVAAISHVFEDEPQSNPE